MKKVLLTLIVSLAFCGSIFAQSYTSHWADFNLYNFPFNAAVVAMVQIDDEFIEPDDNWAAMELAAFVDGECRGHMFMNDETDLGDPHPAAALQVYYTNAGEPVDFKLFDHANGIEYDVYTSNFPILTGDFHDELWLGDLDNAIVISFTSAGPTPITLTKDIIGYGEGDGNYYLIASPIGTVNPENVENMTVNEFDLFAFDQSQDGEEWRNYKVEAFDLESGKGYLYANIEDVTLTFTGMPYTGNGEVILTKADGVDFSGWNLVGNPFAETAYIDRPFYTMNDGGTGIMPETVSRPIEPMEGLFVLAETDGEILTFSTTAPGKGSMIALNCCLPQGRGVIDRTIVRFDEGDVLPKFQLNENDTKVYIPMDGNDYAVVRSEEMGELPVNFKAGSNGSYMLTLSSEEAEFSYLHLIDDFTGDDIDLLETPSYTFNAQTTDNVNRFRLVFALGTTGINENFSYFSNGNFVINNEGNATLQVVDVTGRIISSESICGNANIHVDAAAGVYMLRLINGDNVKVQKIVVK